MRLLLPWTVVLACGFLAGCLEPELEVEQDTQALAYACGAGTVDVCAGKTKQDLIGPGGNCFLPPDTGEMICSPQCEPDGNGDGKPDNDAKCKVIVVGATQDQCPPEPGCCLRTSEPNDDSEAESQICDWAAGTDNACPSKTGGECPVSGQPSACSTDFDYICHSLGGAWCQCNQIDGLYIGTQCPKDANGNVCAGSCCVNSKGPECEDPVGTCIDKCCTGGWSPWQANCVRACMSDQEGPPIPGDPISLDCHNSVDYFDCLQYGLPGMTGACANWPGLPGADCLEGPPELPTCTVSPNGAVHCDCGQDEPYCGDIGRACCTTDCGANDGCGQCQVCDAGYCVYTGGLEGCVDPWEDWGNQWGDLPAGCTLHRTCEPDEVGGVHCYYDYYECTHPCPACANTSCPPSQKIKYYPNGRVEKCGGCCTAEQCGAGPQPHPQPQPKQLRYQAEVQAEAQAQADMEIDVISAECVILVEGEQVSVEIEELPY